MEAQEHRGLPDEPIVPPREEDGNSVEALAAPDADQPPKGVVATFREAFRRARESRQTRTAGSRSRTDGAQSERSARNRDRTKTLFGMVVALVVLLILFLGVFSSSQSDAPREQATRRGQPSLGRPGAEAGAAVRTGSVAPILSADLNANQNSPTDQVSPEDIGGTARARFDPHQGGRGGGTGAMSPARYGDPALEAYRRQLAAPPAASTPTAPPAPSPSPAPPPSLSDSEGLAKPSLVYVRAATSPGVTTRTASAERSADEPRYQSALAPGTRLLARFQSAASTAAKIPVVAVIEAHYERDGQIVVPAGTKAIGDLQGATRSGIVTIRFHTLQHPGGVTESIDGSAVSLQLGPLKGQVSGTNKGKQFLARTLTGVGTVAAFAVGRPGGFSLSGPVDNSILLRERIAQNVGIAGEQELMNLAVNQDIVVTVPGNARFFMVVGSTSRASVTSYSRPGDVPERQGPAARSATRSVSAAELRELIALKQELDQLNREEMRDRADRPSR